MTITASKTIKESMPSALALAYELYSSYEMYFE